MNYQYRDLQIETDYYAKLYSIADTDSDGRITGKEGATFFRRSGLPDKVLGDVWNIAAKGNAFMEHKEFAVAMRLIAMAQENKPLNLNDIHDVYSLPKFKDVACPNILPAHMNDEDVRKYDQLFLTADGDKDGFVDGVEARAFFSRSELPAQTLSTIWKLCERDGDGKLSKGEFRLSMHLIYWVLQANPMPSVLPQPLIDQALNMILYTAPSKLNPISHKQGGPSPFISSLQAGPGSSVPPKKPTNPIDDLLSIEPSSVQASPQNQLGFNSAHSTVGYNSGAPQYGGSQPQSSPNPGSFATHVATSSGSSGSSVPARPRAPSGTSTTNTNTTVTTGNLGMPTSAPTSQLNPRSQSVHSGSNIPQNATQPGFQSPSLNNPNAFGQSGFGASGQAFGQQPVVHNNAPQAPSKPFSSPFGETPFAQALSASPFGETPFAKVLAQQGTVFGQSTATGNTVHNSASSFGAQSSFDTSHGAQQNASFNSSADGFGPSGQNTGELEWIPVGDGHNYDQSKFVFQHSMPATTFEMRANFTSELSDAMKKVRKDK